MSDPARVLFVCTANRCRSPFAEALARRAADPRTLAFSSAGIEAQPGLGVPSDGRRVGVERGLDLAGHRSARVEASELPQYDLILALARVHGRELLARAPEIRPRLFTLRQFTRWIGEHPRPVRSLLGSWLDAAAADRPTSELVGESVQDDIADPIGRPLSRWRRMADDLEAETEALIAGLQPRRH